MPSRHGSGRMPGIRGMRPMPKHLKLVTGNRGKRSLDYEEPKPEALIPDPPEVLSEEARAEWDRIAPRLLAVGMVTRVDGAALAAYCQAYGRWIVAEAALREQRKLDPEMHGLLAISQKGNAIPSPLLHVCNRAMADMVRYASEFGMTPCSRARVKLNLSNGTNDPTDHFFSS
jgi:P27 family predicted phage terminase small subunit